MRTAIIHDWLVGMRGGERCLETLCEMLPNAEIYTAFYDAENISPTITSHAVYTSAFQSLPGVSAYYRYLLPLYPLVAQSLTRRLWANHRENRYDLVISVSHCLAKNVQPPPGVFHLCYCLTPMRYIWDLYESYFGNRRLEPVIRLAARYLRRWDVRSSVSVDAFVGISNYIARRIERVYERRADVIYPPVQDRWFEQPIPAAGEERGFLCVSALVPYKNVDLIVRTFNELPYELTIVGTGPELAALRRLARENIRFIERVSEEELARLYRGTEAMVFAAEEDFGITPVEVQACGRPVICYARGGALETVSADPQQPSGVFFDQLTVSSLASAISEYFQRKHDFSAATCRQQARQFSEERFRSDFWRTLSSIRPEFANAAGGGKLLDVSSEPAGAGSAGGGSSESAAAGEDRLRVAGG